MAEGDAKEVQVADLAVTRQERLQAFAEFRDPDIVVPEPVMRQGRQPGQKFNRLPRRYGGTNNGRVG